MLNVVPILTKSFSVILLSGCMVLTGVALTGCANTSHQDEGAVIGAVLGGVLGGELGEDNSKSTRNWKILTGAIIGGYIGGRIGENMDETDRLRMGHTMETHHTGTANSWVNPDSKTRYTVTPTKTYETQSGPCREYTMDAVIGGKVEQVFGTACRQDDGSWKVQN